MDICEILDWVVYRAGKTTEASCDLGLIPVSGDIYDFSQRRKYFVEHLLLTWHCSKDGTA